jgi:hypothetical protein
MKPFCLQLAAGSCESLLPPRFTTERVTTERSRLQRIRRAADAAPRRLRSGWRVIAVVNRAADRHAVSDPAVDHGAVPAGLCCGGGRIPGIHHLCRHRFGVGHFGDAAIAFTDRILQAQSANRWSRHRRCSANWQPGYFFAEAAAWRLAAMRRASSRVSSLADACPEIRIVVAHYKGPLSWRV